MFGLVGSLAAPLRLDDQVLQGGADCRDPPIQTACPGYKNVMMFCCEQADNRVAHNRICERLRSNVAVCGGSAVMQSTMASCCAYEWADNATQIFGHKMRLDIPEEWEDWDDDAPVVVVDENGVKNDPTDPSTDPAMPQDPSVPQEAENIRMAMPWGTCNATNEDLQGNEAAKEEWDKWCNENCILEKYGGVGRSACKDGMGTGAIGCVCEQGVKEVSIKEEAVPGAQQGQSDDPAAAASPGMFVPEDASTCMSTTLSATDNWCIDSCSSGTCSVDTCICDEKAAEVRKKQKEQEKKDEEARKHGKPGKVRPETPAEAEARKRVEEANKEVEKENEKRAKEEADAAAASEEAPGLSPTEQQAAGVVSQNDDVIAQKEKEREQQEQARLADEKKRIDENEAARQKEEDDRLADIRSKTGDPTEEKDEDEERARDPWVDGPPAEGCAMCPDCPPECHPEIGGSVRSQKGKKAP